MNNEAQRASNSGLLITIVVILLVLLLGWLAWAKVGGMTDADTASSTDTMQPAQQAPAGMPNTQMTGYGSVGSIAAVASVNQLEGTAATLSGVTVQEVVSDRAFYVTDGTEPNPRLLVLLNPPLDAGAAENRIVAVKGQRINVSGQLRTVAVHQGEFGSFEAGDRAAVQTQQAYVAADGFVVAQ